MQFFQGLSLSRKIIIPVVAVSSVVLLGFGITVLDRKNEAVATALESKAESIANFLQKASVTYYSNYDLNALQHFAKDLSADPDIAAVAFYDNKGKSVTDETGFDVPGAVALTREVKEPETGNLLGTLKLAYKTDRVKAAGRSTLVVVLLGIFLGEAALAAVIAWLVRRVVRDFQLVNEDLRKTSGVLKTSSVDLRQNSEFLLSGFTEQAVAIEKTVLTLNEINATADNSRGEASMAATAAKTSEQEAVKGKRAVEQVITAIEEISQTNHVIMEEVEAGNKKIEDILMIIKEIDTKTKVINDIVFQTKLLSFNASVEAARAGEHGKGFAVVAEEVGNLALTSGKAAVEISAMLDESKTRVDAVIREMNSRVGSVIARGREKVKTGSDVACDCGEALERIVQHASEVSRMVSNISSSLEEQAKGVHSISVAMNQLDSLSSASVSRAEKNAGVAESLLSQSGELEKAIESLNRNLEGVSFESSSDESVLVLSPAVEK